LAERTIECRCLAAADLAAGYRMRTKKFFPAN
jgi:hypothetical protein